MGVADDLGSLRTRCVELHDLHHRDEQLGKALSGLLYAFKSLKFVPPRTDELLSGEYGEVVKSNRADEACYLAESLIRSLHPAGDLLAQAVNISALTSKHGRGTLSLSTLLGDTSLDARLATALRRIRQDTGYDYVQEFTNATKHREFVERAVLHDDNHHRIEFQPFIRRSGKLEPRRDFALVVQEGSRLISLAYDVVALLVSNRKKKAVGAAAAPTTKMLSITASAQVPDFNGDIHAGAPAGAGVAGRVSPQPRHRAERVG